MKTQLRGALVLASAIATCGMWSAAVASLKFSKEFASTYKIEKTSVLGKASCGACHVGKTKKLNPYGVDLQKAMRSEKTKLLTGSVLKKVEGLDSDNDKKSNLEEIEANTLPGDPTSN